MKIFLVLVLFLLHLPSLQADDQIKIGGLLCLSGGCADWGTAALNGALLAAEEINQTGGILEKIITIVPEDTKEAISGAQTVSSYKKLLNGGHRIIIGPSWAPGALSILELSKKADDLLLITPSASVAHFSSSASHLFNMRAAEEAQAKLLAEYAYDAGHRKGVIFSSQQAAEMKIGRAFRKRFTELGGEISYLSEPTPGSFSKATATKALNTKPEFIFLSCYTDILENLKQLKELKFPGLKMSYAIDQGKLDAANKLFHDLVIARFSPPSKTFVDSYKKRFKTPPGPSAEGGYDAVYALSYAAVKCNCTSVAGLKKELLNIQFNGASGEIRFDKSGQLIQKPNLYKINGAVFEKQY